MKTTINLMNKAMNRIDGNKRGMDEVIGFIEEAIWGVEAIAEAARALYMAGRWDCAGLPADQQARLWEALRDALELPAGTATKAGV